MWAMCCLQGTARGYSGLSFACKILLGVKVG